MPVYEPSVESLRYRKTAGYNEMLDIVSELEMDKVVEKSTDVSVIQFKWTEVLTDSKKTTNFQLC